MIDKTLEIASFLKSHYIPGTIKETKKDLQLSTIEVLDLLFQIFPKDCIDDYEMHQLLTNLGYTPQKRGATEFVWCLKEL